MPNEVITHDEELILDPAAYTWLLVGDNMVLLPSQLSIFDSLFQNRAPAIPGQEGEARINEAYRMAATLLGALGLRLILEK